jgi:hypothetical protein
VDNLRDLPAFGWINGPAGAELGTDADAIVHRLGPAQFDLGIIAGTVAWAFFYILFYGLLKVKI